MTDVYTYASYSELAADHLRRIIWDLNVLVGKETPIDALQLIQRAAFALTCVEADNPKMQRYDLDADMPYAGRDDAAGGDDVS